MSVLLLDVGLPGGSAALIAGAGFFFILAAAAYVVFRVLRKTVRMAFRMAMVVTVFVTLAIGSIAAYWFGSGTFSRPSRPERSRPR